MDIPIAAVSPPLDQERQAAPVLSVRNLRTVFPTVDGDIVAIDGVSFDIRAGETVAVVGESGSGTSVTAKSILRLTDDQGGEVRSGGHRDGWATKDFSKPCASTLLFLLLTRR